MFENDRYTHLWGLFCAMDRRQDYLIRAFAVMTFGNGGYDVMRTNTHVLTLLMDDDFQLWWSWMALGRDSVCQFLSYTL